MGQHSTPLIRDIQYISVALLALLVFEGGISRLAILVVIIFFLHKMDDNIFDAVGGLGIEEIKGIVRGGKMAVHAVRHETLGVIYVG
jgi:hypothetical protein